MKPNLDRGFAETDPLLQAFRIGPHAFPGIWRSMFPAALARLQFPEERRASCSNCPKACYDDYRADYRCCTYHPRIPNFLLGLAQETNAGQKAVDELLRRGMLLPEGMHSSPQQWLDFLDDSETDQFGRSQKVLCPMLDPESGFCNAHAFRNAVCSTYFCYHDHGSSGELFWSLIQTLGTQLEMRLGQWALRQIGFDLDHYFVTLNELAPHLPSLSSATGWTPAALAKLWGPWYGREKQLLKDCATLIAKHRDELWTIAQDLTIQEAPLFDQALLDAVPEAQRSELEAEDESATDRIDLEELWQECLDSHAELWSWPAGRVTLSPNARIIDNPRLSPEQIYAQAKPYILEYRYPQQDNQLAFSLGLDASEQKILALFDQQPRELSQIFAEQAWLAEVPRARSFMSEMLRRKVLWSVPKIS